MNPGLGWLTLRFYLNSIVLVPWWVILAGILKTLLLHHDLNAGLSLQSYYKQLCCNRLPVPQNGRQEVNFMYDINVQWVYMLVQFQKNSQPNATYVQSNLNASGDLFCDLFHLYQLSTSELAPWCSSSWCGYNSSLTSSVTLSVSDSAMSSSLLMLLPLSVKLELDDAVISGFDQILVEILMITALLNNNHIVSC